MKMNTSIIVFVQKRIATMLCNITYTILPFIKLRFSKTRLAHLTSDYCCGTNYKKKPL